MNLPIYQKEIKEGNKYKNKEINEYIFFLNFNFLFIIDKYLKKKKFFFSIIILKN